MKKIDLKNLQDFNESTCITIGFFDGIHKGHQCILNTLIKTAKLKNLKSVVITFDDSVLKRFKMSRCIMDMEEKIKTFNQFEIDYILLLSVTDNFMNLSADEFIHSFLNRLNCQCLVGGSDFHFAKNKEGNISYLKKNTNYDIVEVKDVYIQQNKVSSTYIRQLILNGQVQKANELLFTPFKIYSKVIDGRKIGRTIGFKTANIQINESCLLLKHGVYFGRVEIEHAFYKAMINVGYNPTIKEDKVLKIEAHILNFEKQIYDCPITLIFQVYHREEMKFASLEELKAQLNKDVSLLENLS